jgi:hypothetical protein
MDKVIFDAAAEYNPVTLNVDEMDIIDNLLRESMRNNTGSIMKQFLHLYQLKRTEIRNDPHRLVDILSNSILCSPVLNIRHNVLYTR